MSQTINSRGFNYKTNKMKTKNLLFASVMATVALFASCDDCDDNGCNKGETCECGSDCDCKHCDCDPSITQISDLGGGGDFLVVNMSQSDSILLHGAAISIGKETLTFQNGTIVKVKFVQAEKYKDYAFNTSYTFADGTVIENEPEYEFVVTPELTGEVELHAEYKHEDKSCHGARHTTTTGAGEFITATAWFDLQVIE